MHQHTDTPPQQGPFPTDPWASGRLFAAGQEPLTGGEQAGRHAARSPARLGALTHMAPDSRLPVVVVLPLCGTGSVAERKGAFRR